MVKKRFLIYHNVDSSIDEPEKTRFEYNVGDIINVNSYGNQYKCIKVEECEDSSVAYHFKQGKKIYTYDY